MARTSARKRKRTPEKVVPPAARKGGTRYTPPKPITKKRSPLWVPATMFACMAAGMIVIVADFLQLLPGGVEQTSDLLFGLGLLIVGFAISTQYR
jgi:hypothetical protein